MSGAANKIDVYLEMGKKRTFASAVEWPGWCRSGRDEEVALQALVDYGPRYARLLQAMGSEFRAPADVSVLAVVERLEGTTTTDFGAPDATPSNDTRPLDEAELQRLQRLMEAYWQAFDAAVQAASGKELRKGPRGGGRELESIVGHVLGADTSYLKAVGWKLEKREAENLAEELARTRQAVLDALAAAARGELPTHGPRGGIMWTPRYFARRVAWHLLDHLWEIEDRVT